MSSNNAYGLKCHIQQMFDCTRTDTKLSQLHSLNSSWQKKKKQFINGYDDYYDDDNGSNNQKKKKKSKEREDNDHD